MSEVMMRDLIIPTHGSHHIMYSTHLRMGLSTCARRAGVLLLLLGLDPDCVTTADHTRWVVSWSHSGSMDVPTNYQDQDPLQYLVGLDW